ncbi:MAG: chromosome segregation protein SMC, partial [Propionicimonas sp.]|nr:chromosome segregation protein SMC [Propionicimonas sp.]
LGGPAVTVDPAGWPALPSGASYARDLVDCDTALRPALDRLLFKVAVVEQLSDARELVTSLPDITAVTREGDLLSSWFAAGGSQSQPSLIEVQAAVAEATEQLQAASAESERLRFALAAAEAQLAEAQERAEAALARLNESDAAHAGLAEEAADLNQSLRAAAAEIGRLETAMERAREVQRTAVETLEGLEERLELASAQTDLGEVDPTDRERAGDASRAAIQAEMEARLALRTVEERARALAGRAESLLRSAQAEREARERAALRREQLRREAVTAAAVQQAASWLAGRIAASLEQAGREREATQARRADAEAALASARSQGRELSRQFEELVDVAHRDQLARAQQQMKVEALAEKALTELGLEVEALLADYGPENLVEILVNDQGVPFAPDEPRPDPVPYLRAEQEKRLRRAERDLTVLGKVNPLALEEFDALQARHAFLAEQLEDLRKTRADLAGIIDEVDARVQQVFAEAYADVEKAFEESFSRLFPGGEGRLVLTEPGEWLTTGVEVEARPAGKKVKRLSLLSGGERSLVAVAFLVALFKARPSP